jgi:integrase
VTRERRRAHHALTHRSIGHQRPLELEIRIAASHAGARGISSLSVADWAKRFIDEKKRSGVRPKSIAKIGEAVNSFVATCSARKVQLMRDVTADEFHAHRDDLQTKRKNDPKTIYTKSIILKEFVRAWCDADPAEPRNPLARVRLREVRSPKQPAPPIDQLKDVVNRTLGDEREVLSILLFTGCRVGDVLRLRAADVDLKRGWITFGSTPHGDPKKHGLVRVPVHPKLLPILTARLQSRRGDELVFDNGVNSEGRQKPLPERRVNAAVARSAEAIGLPVGRRLFGLVAHSFRHGFKTYCINQGVPQFVVDAWQGHAGDGSASSMYYQLTDDESQRQMKSLTF